MHTFVLCIMKSIPAGGRESTAQRQAFKVIKCDPGAATWDQSKAVPWYPPQPSRNYFCLQSVILEEKNLTINFPKEITVSYW